MDKLLAVYGISDSVEHGPTATSWAKATWDPGWLFMSESGYIKGRSRRRPPVAQ